MMDDARNMLREHLRARPAGPSHLEVDTALAELAKVDGDLKQLAPVHVHVLVRAVDELKLAHLREQEPPADMPHCTGHRMYHRTDAECGEMQAAQYGWELPATVKGSGPDEPN
ncbi:hypothetical protein HOT31_gp030 [Microbacterium phage Hendrix]|uniref:Uncharacterized protein n=1 Tax=Microbacterium phage Hendrix TaxID=2182341 RepID=A0A2U8UU45_9CAUD|nr:hypothetical protein HOT31_gp030 [Microbacterium phage Hendrix]AWN07701.1 hypothetical protein PBI_HENDRIX_30 [Microbacterium phage Hendrix]